MPDNPPPLRINGALRILTVDGMPDGALRITIAGITLSEVARGPDAQQTLTRIVEALMLTPRRASNLTEALQKAVRDNAPGGN